ncbi:MAG: CDP-alcohol phosphatidyltransferase family protein [bacterium]
MNIPNALTVLRILLIPLFATFFALGRRGEALAVFALAALTDVLDGYIARIRGMQTPLGSFLDPMADKLLMATAFIIMSTSEPPNNLPPFPVWITATVIGKDAMVPLGWLISRGLRCISMIRPNRIGKLSTSLQALTVSTFLLDLPYTFILWYIMVGSTILSGAIYIAEGFKRDRLPEAIQ